MKIVHDYPPNWKQILGNGMEPNPDLVIVNYGGTLYVPSGKELPDDLIAHEEVHTRQQKSYAPCRSSCFSKQDTLEPCSCHQGAEAWWQRYLTDSYFRISQETEAYAAQYKFICQRLKDRNQRNRVLMQLAGILAGPTYGNMITTQAAMLKIKERAGIP